MLVCLCTRSDIHRRGMWFFFLQLWNTCVCVGSVFETERKKLCWWALVQVITITVLNMSFALCHLQFCLQTHRLRCSQRPQRRWELHVTVWHRGVLGKTAPRLSDSRRTKQTEDWPSRLKTEQTGDWPSRLKTEQTEDWPSRLETDQTDWRLSRLKTDQVD